MFGKWEKAFKALLCALLLLGMCAYPAWAQDGEEALRLQLEKACGMTGFPIFLYGDYDGDGIHEAFALAGSANENGYAGDLWFVSPRACEPVKRDAAYLNIEILGSSAPMLLAAEEWYGGSGSQSHLWSVIGSAPLSVNSAMYEGFARGEGNEFYSYPSAFDAFSDGTGHTGKEYYFFLDGLTMREYGGISISMDQLLEFDGAAEIIRQAETEGNVVTGILYRGNGIINVNLQQAGEGAIRANTNLALRYDDTGVALIRTDSGVYQAASDPFMAVYPAAFVSPATAAPAGAVVETEIIVQEAPVVAEEPTAEATFTPSPTEMPTMPPVTPMPTPMPTMLPMATSAPTMPLATAMPTDASSFDVQEERDGIIVSLDLMADGSTETIRIYMEEQDDGYGNMELRYCMETRKADGSLADLSIIGTSWESKYMHEIIRIAQVDDDLVYVESMAHQDGTSINYMLFRWTGDALIPEMELGDPGYSDGEAIYNRFNGEALYYLEAWDAPPSTPYASSLDALNGELGGYGLHFAVQEFTFYHEGEACINECNAAVLDAGQLACTVEKGDLQQRGAAAPHAAAAVQDDADEGGIVRVEGGSANIRSGPGLIYGEIGVMTEGSTAKYLGQTISDERGVDWHYINYDGRIGWISSRYGKLQ